MVRGPVIEKRPLPGAPVVRIEGGAAQAHGHARRGGISQVVEGEAEGDRRIIPEGADLTEVHVIREPDHAARVAAVQEHQREADAQEEDEERRGVEEDRYREKARRGQELPPDHATAPQNAGDVDGEAGAIARSLAVVPAT